MFEVDKEWLDRLYQCIYAAQGLGKDDIVIKLKKLELKFFKLDMEDEDWMLLNDIEDNL